VEALKIGPMVRTPALAEDLQGVFLVIMIGEVEVIFSLIKTRKKVEMILREFTGS